MRIASFDIGIKNLAFCIIEWNGPPLPLQGPPLPLQGPPLSASRVLRFRFSGNVLMSINRHHLTKVQLKWLFAH